LGILVAGGTGTISRLLVVLLVAARHAVTVISRDEARVAALKPSRGEILRGPTAPQGPNPLAL
jgi:uncharacterized protein YbjT (DUF2867 family)